MAGTRRSRRDVLVTVMLAMAVSGTIPARGQHLFQENINIPDQLQHRATSLDRSGCGFALAGWFSDLTLLDREGSLVGSWRFVLEGVPGTYGFHGGVVDWGSGLTVVVTGLGAGGSFTVPHLMFTADDGTLIRAKKLGVPQPFAIAQDLVRGSHGITVAGYTTDWGSGGSYYAFVANVKKDLTVLNWGKVFSAGSQYLLHLDVAPFDFSGGGYLVAASMLPPAGTFDIVLLRLDNDGELVWSRRLLRSSVDEPRDVATTNDGTFIVAGTADGNGLLMEIDVDGELLWAREYSTQFESVVATGDGILAAGTVTGLGFGNDAALVKTTPTGTVLWSRALGGSGNEWAFDLTTHSQDRVALAGEQNGSLYLATMGTADGDVCIGRDYIGASAPIAFTVDTDWAVQVTTIPPGDFQDANVTAQANSAITSTICDLGDPGCGISGGGVDINGSALVMGSIHFAIGGVDTIQTLGSAQVLVASGDSSVAVRDALEAAWTDGVLSVAAEGPSGLSILDYYGREFRCLVSADGVGWEEISPESSPTINGLVFSGMGGSSVDVPVVEGNEILSSLIATPNPFATNTMIRWSTTERSRTSLAVYDVTGRRIRSLVDATLGPGEHARQWDGRAEEGGRLPAGVYFYRLQSGVMFQTRKITVLR